MTEDDDRWYADDAAHDSLYGEPERCEACNIESDVLIDGFCPECDWEKRDG